MEIERKFLLNKLPDHLECFECYTLEQAYIATNPVIRIRKKMWTAAEGIQKSAYILTIKSGGLMVREEYEINITDEGYENLSKKAEGNVITKNRYIIPLEDELKLELDIFKGVFEGLIIGEVEFPDEDTAQKYTPPEYISAEVTFDRRFSNSAMSSMSPAEISKLLSLGNVGACG